MPDTKAIINDEDGTLASIQALANDSEKSAATAAEADRLVIEGANNKDSMHEAVQEHLDTLNADELTEVSPTTDEQAALVAQEAKPTSESALAKEDEDAAPVDEEKVKEEERLAQAVEERLDKHPRFQELIAEKNALTPYANNAKLDEQFCQLNNISFEQKKTAMELCAMLNKNPDAALAQLEKHVENIKLSTGKLLSVDLAKEVQEGTMSKERATELHMSRLKLAAREQEVTRSQQTAEQQKLSAVTQALNDYGNQLAKTDPDFKPKKAATDPDSKYEMVLKEIKVRAMDKYPTTPQEAVALAKDAYTYVQSFFSRLTPTPRARRQLRITDLHSSDTSQNNEPKPGETIQQYMARTVGKRHGLVLNGE